MLIPFLAKAQNELSVHLHVVPGQTFSLINDSLFPPDVLVDATAVLTVDDSTARTAEILLKNEAGVTLASINVLLDPVGKTQRSIPLGRYSGLNHFYSESFVKDHLANTIHVLQYSSIQ